MEELKVPTVYLVVAVTMNHRQVVIPVIAVITIEVMDFNHRLGHEDKSTALASSLLGFQ